ncbi:uncharacterized protein [Argopecten irradians]|uniref:uncharacterized protein n=1 Tax=Argopecten irradians TaxID=31199 RepID=UPI00371213D2
MLQLMMIRILFYLGSLISPVSLYRTIDVSVTTDTGNIFSTTVQVQEGMALLGSGLISESQPYGLIQCIRKCLLLGDCVGLVHQGVTCTLGKQLDGFATINNPSSVYVQKSTISSQLDQALADVCNSDVCGERYVCQLLAQGYQCIPTECVAFPFALTNSFVNVSVGATNTLTCANNLIQHGSAVQTCQASGQWSPGDLNCAPACDTSLGYVEYPDACFRYVQSRTSKLDALAVCQQEGASLARIDSQTKYDAMASMVDSLGGLYYIEGYQSGTSWYYEDGTVMTYTNWYTSSYTPGPCVAYYPNSGITQMDCAVGHYFLCEMI